MSSSLFVVVVVVWGCSSERVAPTVPAGRTATTASSCDARMSQLSARLELLTKDGRAPDGAPKLIPSTGGRSLRDQPGVIVFVEPSGKAIVFGTSLPNEDLGKQLDVDRRVVNEGWPVFLAVGEDVPAVTVSRVAAIVRARKREVRLLVAGPMPAQPSTDAALFAIPSVKTLRADLDSAAKQERGTRISKALNAAIVPCGPIVKVWGEAAASTRPRMHALLTDAARECECELADVDVFEYLLLLTYGAFEQAARTIEVPAIAATDRRTMARLLAEQHP